MMQLNELKMSPGVFDKFLNSSMANGIQAGFELEMVFKDLAKIGQNFINEASGSTNYDFDFDIIGGGSSDSVEDVVYDTFDPDLVSKFLLPSFKQLNSVSKVHVNSSQGTRYDNAWVIESDPTVNALSKSDVTVEIVSPPMALSRAVDSLSEVIDWAIDHGAYTNQSTGFHVGVSLPNVGERVDFVKLILFVGDEYTLDSFSRKFNGWAESATRLLQHRVEKYHSDEVMAGDLVRIYEAMTVNLQKAAESMISSDNLRKGMSVSVRNGYIEFRHGGGDYLAKSVDDLKYTMLRYSYAMTVAANQHLGKNEYAKKLYKLLTPSIADKLSPAELLQLSSGNIKDVLKTRISTHGGSGLVDKLPPVKPTAFIVVSPRGEKFTIMANSPADAIGRAKASYPEKFNYPQYMIKVAEVD